MEESLLSRAEKENLVTVVKMTQRQQLKGDKGDWKEFLKFHDRQLGNSMSDPAKRSVADLVTYLKTFSKEEDLRLINSMLKGLSIRKSVADTPDESPQQRLVRLTLQHPDYLMNYSVSRNNEEWAVTKIRDISKAVKSNSMVAVDCEMVLCEDETEEVVQVCVVDQNLEIKLNELVKPNKAVADYRSGITGISAEDLEGVTCSLAHIQKKMKKLLRHGTILVGHSLNNDLRALKLDHARVIDTSYIFDTASRKKPSLNDLCKTVLGYDVRKVGAPHNCLDDAKAAMKLVLAKLKDESDDSVAKLKDESDGNIVQINKDVPESELAKLLLHGIPRSVPHEELQRIFPDFTFQVEPRISARKQTQKKYTAVAIFENPKSAHKAFESINSKVEKDTAGFPQKLVEFVLSTGMPATVYVRKMELGNAHEPSAVEEEGLNENTTSKKRSAEESNKDDPKKPKLDVSRCEHHLIEIGSLKAELRQKNEEIESLHKILAAFARKQGL